MTKIKGSRKVPFWKIKSLKEMTLEEWELLCDRCGICCCEKIKNEETGRIDLVPISCQFLDPAQCGCMIYQDRLEVNPDCMELTLETLKDMTWLPHTCAYRCIAEGRDLEWWHPLVSGHYETVHQAGISVRDKIIPGRYIHPKDWMRKE